MNKQTRAFAPFEWMIAGRYLRARRRESFISVIAGFSFIGILLGVATLIIVMAVMNGFRKELLDRILGINGHVIITAAAPDAFKDYDAVAERLRAVPGVSHAVPFVEGQALASGPRQATGAIVRGMHTDDLNILSGLDLNTERRAAEDTDIRAPVFIGARLARRVGTAQDATLTLVSPRGPTTPFGMAPRARAFVVADTFEVGMSDIDSGFVFMPLDAAQRFFGLRGTISGISVMLEDPETAPARLADLRAAAGAPVHARDWQKINATFAGALKVERNVMFVILTLIVLVAALNIISGLVMLVKDKSAGIAMLRAMGATRGAVLRIFLLTGSSIGITGTLAGFALGALFCTYIEELRGFVTWITGSELFPPEVYFLAQLPARMDTTETALVVIMALVLSFAATIYPAWRAARLDPVEALRYE